MREIRLKGRSGDILLVKQGYRRGIMIGRRHFIGFVSLLCWIAGSAGAESADEILRKIHAAELDPGSAVQVSGLDLDMGAATLRLDDGFLIPAAEIDGRTLEMVFIGDGRFLSEPPDRLESYQLSLFTGQSQLEVPVTDAVIVVGNGTVAARLLDRSTAPAPPAETVIAAEEKFSAWVSGAERRGFGADAAALYAAMGDTTMQNYFAVVLDSETVGRFFYLVDPTDLEQVSLGQFTPLNLDAQDRHVVEKDIRRAQRRGRSIQTRLEDIGDWDNWMRFSLRSPEGDPQPGSPGFEPVHYVLDVKVDPRDQKIEGTATVELEVAVDGRRGVTFELFADLTATEVRDAEGEALAFFRHADQLHVALAESPPAGSKIRISVDYSGVLFDRLEKGTFRNRSTMGWYPSTGVFNRATYDVTLRHPKSIQLLGSGTVVESRTDGDSIVERREMAIRASGFTFEIGDFKIFEEQVGHVRLVVGFSKSSLPEATDAREHVIETLKSSLAFFEERFGPYPLDYLTVATIPRGFSQGLISFLTLSQFVMTDPYWEEVGQTYHAEEINRKETVAHELAHQWWGNKVGWYNYRDQWLSEALAQFSAVTYMAGQVENSTVYRARSVADWRWSLGRGTLDGRTVDSIGPVVMGERLFSSRSNIAYTAVVYDKGSTVFSMLARMLGEEPLTRMLGSLADAVGNRAIDTDVFLRALERMSGLDLTRFADRYIYGTGIPEIYYRYRFEETPAGTWKIVGEAKTIGTARFRYTVEPTANGSLDVQRRHSGNDSVDDLAFVVPFQISLEGSESKGSNRRPDRFATSRGFGGNLVLLGESTPIELEVPEQPADFWLDQQGQILAKFYSESRAPKRVKRLRARELEGEQAEALFREALEADAVSEREAEEWKGRELDTRSELENASILLDLARLYLNRGDAEAARKSYERAEDDFKGLYKTYNRSYRNLIACRLDLHAGDYKSALDRLRGFVRLEVPREAGGGMANDLLRRRWREGSTGDGEDYALLAIAAAGAGEEQVARLAIDEAEKRNVDMSLVKSRLAESTNATP